MHRCRCSRPPTRDGKLLVEAIEPHVALVPMSEGQETVEDYRTIGLSLRAHPLAFLRDELDRRKMIPCAKLKDVKDGRWVDIAGLVLLRQKPGSAKNALGSAKACSWANRSCSFATAKTSLWNAPAAMAAEDC